MSPVTGPQRHNDSKTDEQARQGSYQEIHAAILELYRLMGAPRSLPTTASPQYFPGYSVYTYPAAPQATPYQPTGAPQYVNAWPTTVAPAAIVGPYPQASASYYQPQPPGVQSWATGAF